jgi:hypothetical protein
MPHYKLHLYKLNLQIYGVIIYEVFSIRMDGSPDRNAKMAIHTAPTKKHPEAHEQVYKE